ncbi:P-loop NTPase fold protein [Micromonospora sp. DT15]|uniref:P-loop NTPase fold protein n=1 Tax=Micromonospora sp. DT15 TaxID=3393445 RepID=UPI003CF54C12
MSSRADMVWAGILTTPSSLRPQVAQIEQLIGRAGTFELDEMNTHFSDGAGSLIAITGGRGSGKTTLLAAACAHLRNSNRAVVLPPLQPQIFEATDSLLLGLLIQVEDWISSRLTGAGNENGLGHDVMAAIADATRGISVSTGGALEALHASRESTGQYGVDAASIVRHRVRAASQLERVFVEIARGLGLPPNTPVIVPIDDADLSPVHVRGILDAIRALAQVKQAVPMICIDRRQLQLGVAADIVGSYKGHLNYTDASQLSSQVIAKMLRPERTISPPWLSVPERIAFTPIGETVSLGQLLGERSDSASLSSLIWGLADRHADNELRDANAWLPETPRELEYVWETFSAMQRVPSGEVLPIHHARRLIQHLFDYGREYDVAVETAVSRASKASNKGLVLKWPAANLGVAASGRFATAVSTGRLRLRVRKLARITAIVAAESSDAGSGTNEARSLSPGTVAGIQALEELAICGRLGNAAKVMPFYIGLREFEFLQSVPINGENTDDQFFFMPDSSGVQAINRAGTAWNDLVSYARRSSRERQRSGATEMVRKLIHLVTTYWLNGAETALAARRIPALQRSMQSASLEYLKRVQNDDVSHHEMYSLSRAYCHWFEQRLPYLFHQNLLERETTSVIEQWLDAISAGPRAVEATTELRAALEGRFSKKFDEERRRKLGENSWIYGYEGLASSIGTELHADILVFREPYNERRRSRPAGSKVLVGAVGLSEAKGTYEYSTHNTVEGDDDMKVLLEVLEQYRSR